jgi:hypothetical protein
MFFYGRQRRGFPWLLVAIVVAVLLLALTFRLPGGPDAWRILAPILAGVLIAVAVVAALLAWLRPRRRK